MAESYPNGSKTPWEMETLLVTSNFYLFPQCFPKACFPGASKGVIVWEWVKRYHANDRVPFRKVGRHVGLEEKLVINIFSFLMF